MREAETEAPTLVPSSECKIEHCEACFSHNFCTKCKESWYLHKGRCYPACPEGSTAANGTMECGSPGRRVGTAGRGSGTPGGGRPGRVWLGHCPERAYPTTTLWGLSQDFPALWA